VQPHPPGHYQTQGKRQPRRDPHSAAAAPQANLESNPSQAKANTMSLSFAPLAVLLLVLGLAGAGASGGDAPFVVAHKKVALSRPKPGVERLAVSVDLYNQGSASVPFLPPFTDPDLFGCFKRCWVLGESRSESGFRGS
jgi:hypothetical protein